MLSSLDPQLLADLMFTGLRLLGTYPNNQFVLFAKPFLETHPKLNPFIVYCVRSNELFH